MHPEQNVPAQETVYSLTDTVYAWLSLLFAFLFCQALPVREYPLGGFLLIVILFVSAAVILRLKKQKLDRACMLSALSALVIGSALLLTDTGFLIRLSMAYSMASYCYFLYAAFGNRIERGFSNYIYLDFIKLLFILPFSSLGKLFPAIFNRNTKRGSLFLVKVLIGIGIAIIPTALAFSFLSYDSGFLKLIDDIFSVDGEKAGRIVRSLIFSLPLAMYGFGLYTASERKLLHNRMTVESCEQGLQKTKILPQLTAMVAVVPLVFLYVVFFISQWKYYVSGFTGILPEDFSHAEYARQGFFELCSVSVINLLIIVSVAFFIKRGKNGNSAVLKIVAVVFCLCTLILISTAVAKLVMYIDNYGLTQKRIYAMWLMLLIAIVFLLIALGQFLRKLKVVALCVTVAIVMLAGLSVCNVNALCARYNADRYLSGSLRTLDVATMDELGDSAIESLVDVAMNMDAERDPAVKRSVDNLLQRELEAHREEEFSLFSFSIPSARARAALEEYEKRMR